MILVIDAGNTRTKWALAEVSGEAGRLASWRAHGVFLTTEIATAEVRWRALAMSVTDAWVACVAGEAVVGTLVQVLRQAFGDSLRIHCCASQPRQCGVLNGYRDPGSLGVDRWVSAIGARQHWPHRPLLIATFGTATTLDALSADGVFVGGWILPGLELMRASLAQGAALLPGVTPAADTIDFADHTQGAMANGCLAAQVGVVLLAWHQFCRSHGDGGVMLVSGGAHHVVLPALLALDIPCRPHENLVLEGLRAIAAANLSGEGE